MELTDPAAVVKYHRDKGRSVESLHDLKALDLELLDQFTDGMALRWRTIGAAQAGALEHWR